MRENINQLKIAFARGSAKSTLQLETYRKLLGISDEEWREMRREARERVGYLEPNEGGEE